MPAAHGQGPGASRGLLAALRLAAKAIPPARIDIVNPRDSDAIDDRPDDVSILWKNAAQTSPSFSANPSHCSPSFFFFRIHYMDSPDC